MIDSLVSKFVRLAPKYAEKIRARRVARGQAAAVQMGGGTSRRIGNFFNRFMVHYLA